MEGILVLADAGRRAAALKPILTDPMSQMALDPWLSPERRFLEIAPEAPRAAEIEVSAVAALEWANRTAA